MANAKPQDAQRAIGTPFCSSCGYDLTGLTDSPRCPECGKPLVEVLQRQGFETPVGKRYRSKATLFGWPVIDIAVGPHGAERAGRARGIIAIGDFSLGLLSIGRIAGGGVCLGGISIGVLSMAGLSIGLLGAVGGAAISGGLATGGCAIGMLASGGIGIGYVAEGATAVGHFIRDSRTIGNQPEIFNKLRWVLGGAEANFLAIFVPILWIIGPAALLSLIIGAIAWVRLKAWRDGDDASC